MKPEPLAYIVKMSKSLFSLVFIFLSSCCGKHTEIKYEFDGVVITRVDECSRTTFYYQDDQTKVPGKIWVNYSGINGGFSGYLKFSKNKKVLLLSDDGNFRSEGIDTAFFEYRRIYAYNRPLLVGPVCEILLSNKYEQLRNQDLDTGIKINYSIDNNEWW